MPPMSWARLPRSMLPPVGSSAASSWEAIVSSEAETLAMEAEKVGRFCCTAAKAAFVCSQAPFTVCAAW